MVRVVTLTGSDYEPLTLADADGRVTVGVDGHEMGQGIRSAIALHVDDTDCASSVLMGEGFKMLSQDDISR